MNQWVCPQLNGGVNNQGQVTSSQGQVRSSQGQVRSSQGQSRSSQGQIVTSNGQPENDATTERPRINPTQNVSSRNRK